MLYWVFFFWVKCCIGLYVILLKLECAVSNVPYELSKKKKCPIWVLSILYFGILVMLIEMGVALDYRFCSQNLRDFLTKGKIKLEKLSSGIDFLSLWNFYVSKFVFVWNFMFNVHRVSNPSFFIRFILCFQIKMFFFSNGK